MYCSHPTPITLACCLINITHEMLREIGSVYNSIWVDRQRVDIYKTAYLRDWLRRNQCVMESIPEALTRLLALVPDQNPDCPACSDYAHQAWLSAKKELGIDLCDSPKPAGR